ncbi:hypothetical protein PVK06_031051 [Gossypium arboreum]|uniref:Uncharacterized protein n=1 Tax=Gossypium arboreum TaxID=29729 RepID=A0ABR0NSI4_GOSAR|nr:hypothetical protein PVK06_031051 [Gossypium arboreum]
MGNMGMDGNVWWVQILGVFSLIPKGLSSTSHWRDSSSLSSKVLPHLDVNCFMVYCELSILMDPLSVFFVTYEMMTSASLIFSFLPNIMVYLIMILVKICRCTFYFFKICNLVVLFLFSTILFLFFF